jgi:tetratricopeptide (TPR) repeat protein
MVDRSGKLWVADFGLARFGTDTGLTISGDLLGTLRYMAPEQALARHGLVDHRADVYGLGATLYELLTGRPAVDATERAAVLRQIAFEDPTPPRKLDKKIAAELETITLKALAKNPNERYAMAGELAADLRRWLDGQTIKAKPPTLWQRAAKWARRHTAVVWAAAVVLLVTTCALAGGIVLKSRKEAETLAALDTALTQRQRALDNVKVAQKVLERIDLRVAGNHLPYQLQLGEVDQQGLNDADEVLLRDILSFYELFTGVNADDPDSRFELAKAYSRAGSIQRQLEDTRWRHSKEQAVAVLRELVKQSPSNGRYWRKLATELEALDRFEEAVAVLEAGIEVRGAWEYGHGRLGALIYSRWARYLEGQARWAEAEVVWRKRFDLAEEILRKFPDARTALFHLAECYNDRAIALHDRLRRAEATSPCTTYAEIEKGFRKSLDIRTQQAQTFPSHSEDVRSFAVTCNSLGNLLREQGRILEAEEWYREARRRLEGTFERIRKGQTPWLSVMDKSLCVRRLYMDLIGTLQNLGDFAAALQTCRQFLREFPDDLNAKYNLVRVQVIHPELRPADLTDVLDLAQEVVRRAPRSSDTQYVAGVAYSLAERWDEAVASYRQAVRLNPNNEEAHNNLAWLLANCPDPKFRNVAQALDLAKNAVALNSSKGTFRTTLGVAHYRAEDWIAAITALEKAVELNQGGGVFDWFFLAMAHCQLGQRDQAREDYARAVEWMEKNKLKDRELVDFRAEAAALLGIPAGSRDSKPPPGNE